MILKEMYLHILNPLLFGAAFLASVPATGDEEGHDHDHDHGHEHAEEALRSGHADILVLLNDEEGLHLALAADDEHDHGHEDDGAHEHGGEDGHDHEHMELNQAQIVGGAPAAVSIPSAPAYAFLGQPGVYVFVLPQSEVEGLPFVGLNTEELDAASIAGNVAMELVTVEGPGNFFLYETDSFGQPEILLDGTSLPGPSLDLPPGIHRHANWAFTQPGHYELGFVLSATLPDASTIQSEPQIIEIKLTGPARYYSEGHANLAFLNFDEEQGFEIAFVLEEEDHEHESEEGEGHHEDEDDHGHGHDHGGGTRLHPADVITVLGGYALTVIPDDSLFSFLGEAGDPLFLISASPLEGTPFLGFEAEDLLANVLSGPLEIGLHTADGPGEVFLYTVDAGGLPTLLWDSSSPAETYLSLSAGSHKHANIAFTQPGSYTLHLEVEAPLASGSEAHTEVALTFAVGGPEGFFSHFDQPFPDWLLDHSGKWFKTALWPLVWSPGEGWLFAYGPGGPAQYFYAYDRQGWILTNPESGLNAFDFTSADWTSWGD